MGMIFMSMEYLNGGVRFSPGIPVSTTNTTDHHDIAEIYALKHQKT
jgi:hypothetical protein